MRGNLIAALFVGTLVSGCMFWQPSAVSGQKFASLPLGMTRQEVEAVVGPMELIEETATSSRYGIVLQGKSRLGTPLCHPAYLTFNADGELIKKSTR